MTHGGHHWLMALFLALATAFPGCRGADAPQDPVQAFLDAAWSAYKDVFITPDGYVWDQARGEVTSEGQSYALLRAAWMDDRETFDRVLGWTEAHLARPDGLYSWQWTPRDGGRVVDANSAADADQDVAFALILAARAFAAPAYLDRARSLLAAIRRHEGIAVAGGWIPCAGNWAVAERIINFSYFTFYAYPAFAAIDPDGDWPGVRERCYDLLTRFLAGPDVLLPADFAIVDDSGDFCPVAGKGALSDDFSFDAMRVYWRVAMDCRLNGHPRACGDPAGTRAMADILTRDGRLYSRYGVSGVRKTDAASVSFYGSLLPALGLISPQLAETVVRDTLSPARLAPVLRNADRYYDNNWIWFGLAAWSGRITGPSPAGGRP